MSEVGDGARDVVVGQRGAALTETGGWAQYVALNAKKLVTVPGALDPAEAVAGREEHGKAFTCAAEV